MYICIHSWANYKIKQQIDKIGVFVSIVATKIPFKGTGKEYIGDDIEEIAGAVKHAIQQCCLQLKSKLAKEAEMKSRQERKQNLTKYIPSVSKSILTVLEGIQDCDAVINASISIPGGGVVVDAASNFKDRNVIKNLVEKVTKKQVTIKELSAKLIRHVEEEDASQALEVVRETTLKKSACYPIHIPTLQRKTLSQHLGKSLALALPDDPTLDVKILLDDRFSSSLLV